MGHLSPDPRDHSLLLLPVCRMTDCTAPPQTTACISQHKPTPTCTLDATQTNTHKGTHMLSFTPEAHQITSALQPSLRGSCSFLFCCFMLYLCRADLNNNEVYMENKSCKCLCLVSLHICHGIVIQACVYSIFPSCAVACCLCCWSCFVVSNRVKLLHLVSGLTLIDAILMSASFYYPAWLQFDPQRLQ